MIPIMQRPFFEASPRARAVGLSLLVGSEPGGLSLVWWDMLDSSGFDNFCKISKEQKIIAKSMTIWKLCKIFPRSFKWDLVGCPIFILHYSIFNSLLVTKFERIKLQICCLCRFKDDLKLLFCAWISSSSDDPELHSWIKQKGWN